MALKDALGALSAAWDGLPPDVRDKGAETLSVAAAVMAEAIKALGPHAPALVAPCVAVMVQAFTSVTVWRRPFEGPDGVGEEISASFPSAVALLKALAPDESAPPPPPPDAT